MLNRLISISLLVACLVSALALYQDHGATAQTRNSGIVAERESPSSGAAAPLNARVERIDADNVRLEDAIISLAAASKVNICADWQTLEDAGIARSARVRMHLRDVTLDQALYVLVKDLTDHERFPAFYVDHGVVVLSTAASGSRHVVTECINVQPLAKELAAAYVSLFPPMPASPPAKEDKGGLFAGGSDCGWHTDMIPRDLAGLIINNVAPESWRDAGGNVGDLHELCSVLVITQTTENILAIRRFLDDLHRAVNRRDVLVAASGSPNLRPCAAMSATPISNDITTETECINIGALIRDVQKHTGLYAQRTRDDRLDPDEIGRAIVQILTTTVAPQTWRENGGSVGAIHQLGSVIVVRQTPANLKAIHQTLLTIQQSITVGEFPNIEHRHSAATAPAAAPN